MNDKRTLSVVAVRMPLVALTLALWACTGDEGIQGPPGPTGPQGEQGIPGDDGEEGVNSLIDATDLDRGDANCPFGGVMYEVGVDDGSGGGTAGDGVLQPGEVDGTEYVCNALETLVGYDPPGGPRGTGVIDGAGGASTGDADGGEGGGIDLTNNGSAGGHVKVFATGVADASFTMPDMAAYVDLGPNPLEVTTGTVTLDGVNAPSEVADGAYYFMRPSGGAVYLRDSVNGDTYITGLSVSAGATLEVLGDAQTGCCSYYEYVDFDYDCYNAGTITTTLVPGVTDPTYRGGLNLSCANIVTEPGSIIDLSGQDAVAGNYGGEGGALRLSADGGIWYLDYGSIGSLYNQGVIDTSSGASVGNYGGGGGDVNLYADDRLFNSGGISTRSSASNYYGGYPGEVYMYGGEGLYNSGVVDASAATAAVYGRSGSGIGLQSNGEVRNSGGLVSRGADQTDTGCGACTAGGGGNVSMWAGGPGGVVTAGDITVPGGTAAGAPAMGGNGGNVDLDTSSGYGWFGNDQEPGSIHLSGDLDLTGGDAPLEGGDGGFIDLDVSPEDFYNGQEIVLLGYDRIVLDGGDAGPNGGDGGDGGYLDLYNDYSSDYDPSGGVFNYAHISATGGDAPHVSGAGGRGGNVDMWTDGQYAFRGGAAVALNAGNIDVSAGSGVDEGGSGGCVRLFGASWSENSGNLTARGGDATATGTDYASAGWPSCTASIAIYSWLGPATNSGAVDTTGGSAALADDGYGAEGGAVEVVGATVDNAGSFTTVGGDGGAGGGVGGNGGKVYFRSFDDVTATTGTFDTTGGSGATAGTRGTIWVDGINMTPDF